MEWIWYFILYSFIGFLLEVTFARATKGRADRKCLLLLPLCPVYGLGACAILLLPETVRTQPLLLIIFGAVAATAAEYVMAVFYEKALGVSFWDYRALPGNVQGRVCLPFSVAWGALTLPLVYWLHPRLSALVGLIPVPVTVMALVTVIADALISAYLLRRTRDRACLQWYRT